MTLNNSGPLAYPKWDNASSAWWLGVSTGGSGASVGVGVGTSTVLHDPNPPGTIGPMPWWAHPAEVPPVDSQVDYWR